MIVVISHGWRKVAGKFTKGCIWHCTAELGIGVVAQGMEGDLPLFPFLAGRFLFNVN